MEVKRNGSQPSGKGPADWFTGAVRIDPLFQASAPARVQGAIVTFELAGGIPAVKAFVAGLKYFSLAESLGGVESLVAHPASMTHAAMQEPARRAAGLTDGLLRLSVGIEALEDLRSDLAEGLARCG